MEHMPVLDENPHRLLRQINNAKGKILVLEDSRTRLIQAYKIGTWSHLLDDQILLYAEKWKSGGSFVVNIWSNWSQGMASTDMPAWAWTEEQLAKYRIVGHRLTTLDLYETTLSAPWQSDECSGYFREDEIFEYLSRIKLPPFRRAKQDVECTVASLVGSGALKLTSTTPSTSIPLAVVLKVDDIQDGRDITWEEPLGQVHTEVLQSFRHRLKSFDRNKFTPGEIPRSTILRSSKLPTRLCLVAFPRGVPSREYPKRHGLSYGPHRIRAFLAADKETIKTLAELKEEIARRAKVKAPQ